MIDKKLLNILVCPVSKGELSYDEAKQECNIEIHRE